MSTVSPNTESVTREMPVLHEPSSEEDQYLTLLRNIMARGHVRTTRNGSVRSLFAATMTFDLRRTFPLLTTKRVFFRGVFEELKFFMLGQTDTKILEKKDVHIWKGNTSRAFLDSVCLSHYPEGQMGPMYGHQLRHFGGNIQGDEEMGSLEPVPSPTHTPASAFDSDSVIDSRVTNPPAIFPGIDQLQHAIDLLVTDRFSRRILLTTYNPAQTDQGVLPPCHGIAIQFGIEGEDQLCCHMYQRSCDTFLGCPFNIASYALLTHLVCALVNVRLPASERPLVPGTLTMSFGDYHIYDAHVAGVEQQLERRPRSFPTLALRVNHPGEKRLATLADMEQLEYSDLDLQGYTPYAAIRAPMVA